MGLFGSSPKVPDTIPPKTWRSATRGEPRGALRADRPGTHPEDALRRLMAWSAAGKNAKSN